MDKQESKKKIALGADHAGYELKEKITDYLKKKGYEISDFGTFSTESTDYPDFAMRHMVWRGFPASGAGTAPYIWGLNFHQALKIGSL